MGTHDKPPLWTQRYRVAGQTSSTNPVLATELIRRDPHGSRRPTVVDVKPAEHAHDRDRLGRVDGRHLSRRYALVQALVRAALVEIALVSAQKRGEVLVVDEQHMVEQLSAYTDHKSLGHGI